PTNVVASGRIHVASSVKFAANAAPSFADSAGTIFFITPSIAVRIAAASGLGGGGGGVGAQATIAVRPRMRAALDDRVMSGSVRVVWRVAPNTAPKYSPERSRRPVRPDGGVSGAFGLCRSALSFCV